MPFIPFEDCVTVTVQGQVDGQLTINDLSFRSSTGPRSLADVQALVAAVGVWYDSSIASRLNEAWTGLRLTGKGLTNPNGLIVVQDFTATVGQIAGEAAPNNCTMAVSFQTGLSGRSFRGRNYVPCLTNSQVTGNYIDSTWAQSIVDAYSDLTFPANIGILPGGWEWVVLSRKSGGVDRSVGVFTEITNVVVTDLVVDSQRNRLPGRGN